MRKQMKCVVIRPNNYNRNKKAFPVVYLLHGFAGKYSDWIRLVPQLKTYVDNFNLIIVCPEGNYASWYFDSPIDLTMQYETYIGIEVPCYIDSVYRTMRDKEHRAITGLSMGGHGALFVAWRHSDIFGAAGSMSGGLDLKECIGRFDIEKVIGDTAQFAGNWEKYSILSIVETKLNSPISLVIDCGIDDFFITGNRKVHQKLILRGVPHDYIERPGTHNWVYWKNSITYQLMYFARYFQTQSNNPVNTKQ